METCAYDCRVTATVSPIICPDLGIEVPHYLGDDAATVVGCSRKTLERRRNRGSLTARYYHGLVCYPVAEIHALRDEIQRKADLDALGPRGKASAAETATKTSIAGVSSETSTEASTPTGRR